LKQAPFPVTYPFQASCEGYITNKGSVQFVIDKTILHPIPMQPTFLLGDIDGSDQVDLNDAILALKIMGNIEIFYNLNMNADVDGDEQIGKAEVIYILTETDRLVLNFINNAQFFICMSISYLNQFLQTFKLKLFCPFYQNRPKLFILCFNTLYDCFCFFKIKQFDSVL